MGIGGGIQPSHVARVVRSVSGVKVVVVVVEFHRVFRLGIAPGPRESFYGRVLGDPLVMQGIVLLAHRGDIVVFPLHRSLLVSIARDFRVHCIGGLELSRSRAPHGGCIAVSFHFLLSLLSLLLLLILNHDRHLMLLHLHVLHHHHLLLLLLLLLQLLLVVMMVVHHHRAMLLWRLGVLLHRHDFPPPHHSIGYLLMLMVLPPRDAMMIFRGGGITG